MGLRNVRLLLPAELVERAERAQLDMSRFLRERLEQHLELNGRLVAWTETTNDIDEQRTITVRVDPRTGVPIGRDPRSGLPFEQR